MHDVLTNLTNVCLSVCLSVRLSVCSSVCPSVTRLKSAATCAVFTVSGVHGVIWCNLCKITLTTCWNNWCKTDVIFSNIAEPVSQDCYSCGCNISKCVIFIIRALNSMFLFNFVLSLNQIANSWATKGCCWTKLSYYWLVTLLNTFYVSASLMGTGGIMFSAERTVCLWSVCHIVAAAAVAMSFEFCVIGYCSLYLV